MLLSFSLASGSHWQALFTVMPCLQLGGDEKRGKSSESSVMALSYHRMGAEMASSRISWTDDHHLLHSMTGSQNGWNTISTISEGIFGDCLVQILFSEQVQPEQVSQDCVNFLYFCQIRHVYILLSSLLSLLFRPNCPRSLSPLCMSSHIHPCGPLLDSLQYTLVFYTVELRTGPISPVVSHQHQVRREDWLLLLLLHHRM